MNDQKLNAGDYSKNNQAGNDIYDANGGTIHVNKLDHDSVINFIKSIFTFTAWLVAIVTTIIALFTNPTLKDHRLKISNFDLDNNQQTKELLYQNCALFSFGYNLDQSNQIRPLSFGIMTGVFKMPESLSETGVYWINYCHDFPDYKG